MTTAPHACPKCNGRMEQGFILDNAYAAHVVSQWVAGPPLKSFWSGTKIPSEGLVPVGTFRCAKCGYLESYARPEFAAK